MLEQPVNDAVIKYKKHSRLTSAFPEISITNGKMYDRTILVRFLEVLILERVLRHSKLKVNSRSMMRSESVLRGIALVLYC